MKKIIYFLGQTMLLLSESQDRKIEMKNLGRQNRAALVEERSRTRGAVALTGMGEWLQRTREYVVT